MRSRLPWNGSPRSLSGGGKVFWISIEDGEGRFLVLVLQSMPPLGTGVRMCRAMTLTIILVFAVPQAAEKGTKIGLNPSCFFLSSVCYAEFDIRSTHDLRLYFACQSEEGVKAYNANPEITITSHSNNATLEEGVVESFRAAVSDPNHDFEDLLVSWYADTDLICDWAAPDVAGTSYCEISAGVDVTRIVAEVRDPEGSGGQDKSRSVWWPLRPRVFR